MTGHIEGRMKYHKMKLSVTDDVKVSSFSQNNLRTDIS